MTYAFSHQFEELSVGGDLYDGEAWIAADNDGEWAVHSFTFGIAEMLSGHRSFPAFADAFEKRCGEDVQAHIDSVFGPRENQNDQHRLSAQQLGIGRPH